MVEVRRTALFAAWLSRLRDRRARVRIETRIDRLSRGNPGDVRPVAEGVSELRIDHGPGYRVYFIQRGQACVPLICGGNKGTQGDDIALAKGLARRIRW